MDRFARVRQWAAHSCGLLLALVVALASSACSDDSNARSGDPAGCVPSEAEFEQTALPIIEAKCSKCHGREPDHGAPFSLLGYSALVRGANGSRIVDRMVVALRESIMPPPENPQPSVAERSALVAWASCQGTAE
jgi:uncharacterized membrane protein